MRTILRVLGALLLVVAAVGAAIYFTGNTFNVIVWLNKPTHGWDPSRHAPDPDYAQAENWAARPGEASLADYVPKGVPTPSGDRMVDVFFIHPTGYMHSYDWNSPMDANSSTEENTKWMMANQASAFNGCCNVYAPRYREASIFRYMGAPEDIAAKAMDFAYADVERAFEYFLEHDSNGRPFIIASHSQGTDHGFRLLKEKIDGTPLAERLVAAYLIGNRISDNQVATLKSVHICANATDTGCLIHWATFGDGGGPEPGVFTEKLVCVNPLSWLRDGPRAPASMHQGGVPASGHFALVLWARGKDTPNGTQFEPLEAPIKGATWAECRNGLLYVADLANTPFGRLSLGNKNYHGLDYPLFHMDIRLNAEQRVATYLASHPAVHTVSSTVH
ncbi:MAG: DUF3089 domain-containing protein [Alphaproteobacteria bacterium]|nr:DUF3089 domain-containing protein [Alphaproteobacteria bacterium]